MNMIYPSIQKEDTQRSVSLTMFSSTQKVSSIHGILKQAISLPLQNHTLILSITLLILLPCNLLVMAVTELNPIALRFDLTPFLPFKTTSNVKPPFEVELVTSALHWLFNTIGVYSLSRAYVKKPLSLKELFSTLAKEWKKIFVTSFYGELITATSCFLSLASIYALDSNAYENASLFNAVMVILRLTGMAAGLAMLVFVSLACQMSLVISAVEEGCWGVAAFQRTAEIIKGRKLQAFALVALLILLDQVLMVEESEKKTSITWRISVRALATVPIELTLQLFGCSVYCILYLEGEKKQRREEDEEANA